MAEVYWIRLPEHTDMLTEGYIGVTKNDAKARFRGHLQEAKLRDCKTSHLHNYLNKHGREGLVVQTLVICEIEYAFDLEEKLRPSERIGWNVAKGGVQTVNPGGYKLSEDTRRKMSESFDEKRRQICAENLFKTTQARKGIPTGPCPAHIDAKIIKSQFLAKMERGKELWSRCEEFYDFYISGKGKSRACERYYEIELNRLRGMFNLFDKGWKPMEDDLWLSKFKES